MSEVGEKIHVKFQSGNLNGRDRLLDLVEKGE